MVVILGILVALGGAVFWWARSNPGDALGVADDAVTIARNAPRKLAFRRQTREHPVEGVDDPRLALTAIADAYIGLDDLPTREARDRLRQMARILWRMDEADADETIALARWLVTQCQGARPAIARIGRRLHKIDGDASWPELERLLGALDQGAPTEAQADARSDLALALHRRR